MENGINESQVKEWLVEHLPHEVIWMDRHGKIVYANKLFCQRSGYQSNELLRLSIFDINVTVSKESWERHWKKVEAETVFNFKATHKNKKGNYYEVEVYAQFFSYYRNNLICAIVSDITDSSFYRKLMDSTASMADVGGWNLNLQNGSLIATHQALQLFGTHEMQDLTPGRVIQNFQDPEKLKDLLRTAMRKGIPFDEILETAESPSRHLRAIVKPNQKGDKIYQLLGIYQDVSEQIRKENALHLFKEIIDNAEDIIYVIDKQGAILHYSQSALKQLGYSKNEFEQCSVFDLDSSITRDWWDSHFNSIIKEKSLRFEWILTRNDGTKFPVDITANHLSFDNKDYNCAVIRDISDKKLKDLKLYEALEEIRDLKERLENENEYLQEEIGYEINYDHIICKSENYKRVLEKVSQVAPTDTTVLITGESGTGKELLARAIHMESKRKDRTLIKVNCATLPKELIESELFGHKKGAFTGAVADKIGKFTLADGGTLFLDEIGEMPIELQAKLLRVLQEGEFDELGGAKTIKVDVRIISATNRDLDKMIREGTFREDLFYRLNVFPINNIPLRARKDDIPLLAQYFLDKYSVKAGKYFKRLSKKTIDALTSYNFPGNIRELENLIERAVIIESGPTLKPGSWLPDKKMLSVQTDEFQPFEKIQKDYIIKVLEHTNWRVSGDKGAAKILDMNDKTLFAKIKRLGIEKKISAR